VIRYPGRIPAGRRVSGTCRHADLLPTLLELAGMPEVVPEDVTGSSLTDLVAGVASTHDPELYLTEATWMRKHGWRTPEWKLIVALEPDFHFKPEVELYDLRADPAERVNLAHSRPDKVEDLRTRMEAHIAERTKLTGRPNPIEELLDWHGKTGHGPFKSSREAYDTLHIGDPEAGRRLQAGLPTKAPEKVSGGRGPGAGHAGPASARRAASQVHDGARTAKKANKAAAKVTKATKA